MSYRLFESKEYIYTEDGLEVMYDSCGYILCMWIYSHPLNALIKVDLDAFKDIYPGRFEYLQNKVNERII